jgi:conjugative relaxase-like TrwC/TraI family protein
VANGREDYYTGHGEAEGEWTGGGAQTRGLAGTVAEDDFLNLLTGDPARAKTVLGYDLTFSAPKSVSILYGVADETMSRAVRDAHDEAVRQALGYIERHACWTRRGPGGREHLRGDGLTVATFRHRSSRAGDPQLHTHAVVANATEAAGKIGALDGRALYAHARTAGFLYQAALRHELTRTIGVEWDPVEHGVAEIAGIGADVRRHFSQRREEIKDHMSRHGGRSARSAQIAALETRRAKDYDIDAPGLHEAWRARAAEHGLDRSALEAVCDRRAPGMPIVPSQRAVVEHLASSAGITRTASTFDRRDALRDWAEAHREGAPVENIERLADEWLESPAAVRVNPGTDRAHLGGPRYSTPEMLHLERELLDTAQARRNTGVAQAPEPVVDEVLTSEPHLTGEQAGLARRLTRSGDGVEVVRAPAGTGKTYALAAARDIWERAGTRVSGCALAARAAVEMESTAGVDATTIARLRQDIATGYGLPRGSVLIVDEAGMAGTRAIADLARHAQETDSKLVLVGDDRQLPEIDAGGAFRGLADRLGCGTARGAAPDERLGPSGAWRAASRTHPRLARRLPRPRTPRRTAHRGRDTSGPRRRLVGERAGQTRGHHHDRSAPSGRRRAQRARSRTTAPRRQARRRGARGRRSPLQHRRSRDRATQRSPRRRGQRSAR